MYEMSVTTGGAAGLEGYWDRGGRGQAARTQLELELKLEM